MACRTSGSGQCPIDMNHWLTCAKHSQHGIVELTLTFSISFEPTMIRGLASGMGLLFCLHAFAKLTT